MAAKGREEVLDGLFPRPEIGSSGIHPDGRPSDNLVETVVADFFDDFAFRRETLDRRYDDLESGRVKPIPGDEVFTSLRAKTQPAAPSINERYDADPEADRP